MRPIIALLALVSGVTHAQTPTPAIHAVPSIVFEKTRFALGERVFFWIEISTSNDYVIPLSLMSSAAVRITRPDGTTRVDRVGWPADGMGAHAPGDRGWRGGHSLGAERQQLGRYTVVFDFAGKSSEPKSFSIENVDLARRISAAFVFPTPLSLSATDAVVTLTVKNDLADPIVFPHRGEMGQHVSVKISGGGSSSFFVPNDALLRAAGIKQASGMWALFDWDFAERIHVVRLGPGQSYALRIPIADILAGSGRLGIPSGELELWLHTELHVLIGSRDGAWKDFGPLRLNVEGTAKVSRD